MNKENVELIHKEIDLVQSCISRMANNSFILKGWLISLIGILLALLITKLDVKIFCFLILGISSCFWYLDGFYLKLERLYRCKYEWIINEREKGNFKYLYDLNPNNTNMRIDKNKKITILNSIFSKTLIPFYGTIVLVLLIVLIKQLI